MPHLGWTQRGAYSTLELCHIPLPALHLAEPPTHLRYILSVFLPHPDSGLGLNELSTLPSDFFEGAPNMQRM